MLWLERSFLRDAVLVKGGHLAAVFLCGLLVQVSKVLHGRHAALGRLFRDVQLLHKLQAARTLVGELVWTAVMALDQ